MLYEFITKRTCCMNCESSETKKISVLNVNARLIWDNGYDFVQESVLNEIEKETFYCKNCKKIVTGLILEIDSYLFLNVDHFYEANYSSKKVIRHEFAGNSCNT